ncbi:MAG: cupin-like domain-containing protein [Bradymonadia bacterium]
MKPPFNSPDAQWADWLMDNLIRGIPSKRLIQALQTRHIPEEMARNWIEHVKAQKGFNSQLLRTKPIRQSELYLSLRRQLNHEQASKSSIRELKTLDGDTFFQDYYVENRPVVIRGYANDWPAKDKWTLSYLSEHYGQAKVRITDDRLSNPNYDMEHARHTIHCSLHEFIERVSRNDSGNNAYMVANNRVIEQPEMAPLINDIFYDPAIFDAEKWKGCSAFWLGPAGTVTPLHHDTCNILFVQLSGRKTFRLFSPLESDILTHARSMYADIDPENPDLLKHPNFQHVMEKCVTLHPGDAIFLPIGWWHHVRSLDISISFAMTNFVVPNNFDWYRPGEVI